MLNPSISLSLTLLTTLLLITGCGEQEPASTPPATTSTVTTTSSATTQPAEPTSSAATDPQKASATLKDMLALAKAGDWATYIDRHYGESHKFNSPEDKQKLVDRFSQKWGDKVIPALEQAAAVTPEIEGDKAIFKVQGVPIYELHRAADGQWTFHL